MDEDTIRETCHCCGEPIFLPRSLMDSIRELARANPNYFFKVIPSDEINEPLFIIEISRFLK